MPSYKLYFEIHFIYFALTWVMILEFIFHCYEIMRRLLCSMIVEVMEICNKIYLKLMVLFTLLSKMEI